MTPETFANPYADSYENRRAAFATNRRTPREVVEARAATARRMRIGYYSPEQVRLRARNAARFERDQAAADRADRAAEAWFVANQDRMVWIVGTNHDTPVAAFLNGADNVRLCTAPDCCAGVLETDAQRAQRIAVYEGRARGTSRDVMPEWRGDDDEAADMHYLGVISGLS